MANDMILIADGDAARGERIARALEAGGRRCRTASTGVAALEVALSEPPRLIVVQAELPLVEASKLAEILRANPRTRSVQLVVLGRDGRRAAWAGVGEEWLDAKVAPEEIVAGVARLLERQARIEKLDAGAHAESELEGSLVDIRPAELLRLLHVRRVTGRLVIGEGEGEASGRQALVRLVAGEIQSAEIGPVRGEKALFRLLDREQGRFHFEPGSAGGAAEIKLPTRALLAEGLRQLEEWHRLAPKLPPIESPIRMKIARSALPPVLHPLTQEVLGLIDEAGRVGDVIDLCSQPDYQVLRTIQTLAERGIVELGRARIAAPDGFGAALFNEAQARRLRGFVQSERRAGSPIPDAKLLIVATSEVATRRFAELLEKVPGAELSPALQHRGGERLPLASLARIAVDAEFALELIHLPEEGTFAPLWPFAAHRALGTIFLLDAGMGGSASELVEVSAALGRQPGARTFHVVMLGEGERVSPDELRANLALLDSASLFLLPMDLRKDPSSLLRSLFARIVP
jgi:CheY-like chemotaxis protein